MAADGADHIFAAAAASNFGIFEAAKEQNFFTYGVDVNQCPSAPGQVVFGQFGFTVENVLEKARALIRS